jgi:hypothetical protein
MPFRRWFAERGAHHPVVYSMLTLAGGMLVCMVIAVGISVQASNRAIDRSIAQERAAREQQRAAACVLIDTMIEVYSQPTPPTITGRKARDAWKDLGVIFNC